jgi:hypothetical protein
MFPDRGTGWRLPRRCEEKEGIPVSGDGGVLKGGYHKRERGHSKTLNGWAAASPGATGIGPWGARLLTQTEGALSRP